MGKSEHQWDVEEFMEKAGQVVREAPSRLTAAEQLLRARLILEEAFETVEALGVNAYFRDPVDHKRVTHIFFKQLELEVRGEMDIEQVVDGCADLSVVTIGTLSAMGVMDEPVLKLVDDNNLAKFGPGGRRDEGGKWIKPPDHKPPDIKGELVRQREEREYHGN